MKAPKQVIIMRKDLNMRKGKMVAQGSHASMGAVLRMMQKIDYPAEDRTNLFVNVSGPVREWLLNKFTKVCVSVDSEQELLDIVAQAEQLKLPNVLITDSGATEFHGVPTNTCAAIGPWHAEDIDKITGHLKLL